MDTIKFEMSYDDDEILYITPIINDVSLVKIFNDIYLEYEYSSRPARIILDEITRFNKPENLEKYGYFYSQNDLFLSCMRLLEYKERDWEFYGSNFVECIANEHEDSINWYLGRFHYKFEKRQYAAAIEDVFSQYTVL